MKQQFTEEEIYKDRDSQITAIEKTFEDAQKSVIEGRGWGGIGVEGGPRCSSRAPYPPHPPCFCPQQISQHYSKPRVTPVEVMPVFPDFKVRSGAGGSEAEPGISACPSLIPVLLSLDVDQPMRSGNF